MSEGKPKVAETDQNGREGGVANSGSSFRKWLLLPPPSWPTTNSRMLELPDQRTPRSRKECTYCMVRSSSSSSSSSSAAKISSLPCALGTSGISRLSCELSSLPAAPPSALESKSWATTSSSGQETVSGSSTHVQDGGEEQSLGGSGSLMSSCQRRCSAARAEKTRALEGACWDSAESGGLGRWRLSRGSCSKADTRDMLEAENSKPSPGTAAPGLGPGRGAQVSHAAAAAPSPPWPCPRTPPCRWAAAHSQRPHEGDDGLGGPTLT